MKLNTKYLFIFILSLNSCASRQYNAMTLIDNSMDPSISWRQLELGETRGSTGEMEYNKDDRTTRVFDYNARNKEKTVSWLYKNWGVPDRIEKSSSITYYIFDKKSRTAPNYRSQYDEGESPVKVGYRAGKIVYISAFKTNCPKHWKGPNYTLPH